jgi:S-formylglutathione hydrolase
MSEVYTERSIHHCFGGQIGFYNHPSTETKTEMNFSVFMPPQSKHSNVPALLYLAGLTCTEETFMIKAGALHLASEKGLALICPDTSPRGANIKGEDADWDFGTGAGFYLDATQSPWAENYRMYSYITKEFIKLVAGSFPIDPDRIGIFGHSMGGHGALTLHLKNPTMFKTVSAFAPICAPTVCPWGEKAFSNYLGNNPDDWNNYDATQLIKTCGDGPNILIDQGLADDFLEKELHPHLFEEACRKSGRPLTIRRHDNYDHGYYFISSFMSDHIDHHMEQL